MRFGSATCAAAGATRRTSGSARALPARAAPRRAAFREVREPGAARDARRCLRARSRLARHRFAEPHRRRAAAPARGRSEAALRALRARGPRDLPRDARARAPAPSRASSPHVDVVSMDWKLASDVRRASDPKRGPAALPFHGEHEAFLAVARGRAARGREDRDHAGERGRRDRRGASGASPARRPRRPSCSSPSRPSRPVRERPSAARMLALERARRAAASRRARDPADAPALRRPLSDGVGGGAEIRRLRVARRVRLTERAARRRTQPHGSAPRARRQLDVHRAVADHPARSEVGAERVARAPGAARAPACGTRSPRRAGGGSGRCARCGRPRGRGPPKSRASKRSICGLVEEPRPIPLWLVTIARPKPRAASRRSAQARAGQQRVVLDAMHVAGVAHERAVAIEEHEAAHPRRLSRSARSVGCPPRRRARRRSARRDRAR